MTDKDAILLHKVKNSDKIAFKTLFFNYHDTLFRFVQYKIQDGDIAEDIMQELVQTYVMIIFAIMKYDKGMNR